MNWQPGQELYSVYRAVQSRNGVDTDDWSQLDEDDRKAWRATAVLVGAELSDEALQLLEGEELSGNALRILSGDV